MTHIHSQEKERDMELNGNDFLEEWLGESFPDLLSFDSFVHYNNNTLANLPHQSSWQSGLQNFNGYCTLNDGLYSDGNHDFSETQITDSSCYNTVDSSFGNAHPLMSIRHEDDDSSFLWMDLGKVDSPLDCRKLEAVQTPEMLQVFSMDTCLDTKTQTQKLQGKPSKNLMAERRRRKRLNDRLSMLRAIVPKISKLDRTSILGDTIAYMKELLEKINKVQQEREETHDESIFHFKDQKANDQIMSVKNSSPQFSIEKRDEDTKIGIMICCDVKPGLLQTMVNSFETLGLEMEECVVSCFHEFAMQASCYQELDHRTATTCEDIKQALLRNAGYGEKGL